MTYFNEISNMHRTIAALTPVILALTMRHSNNPMRRSSTPVQINLVQAISPWINPVVTKQNAPIIMR